MAAITARQKEYELFKAFLPREIFAAPQTLLIQGNPSTGKTYTLRHYLKSIKVNHSIIECDQCVSSKILWKRVISALQLDSGILRKNEIQNEAAVSASFQGFLRALREFLVGYSYKKLHYIVLDRVDQVMEDGDQIFCNFGKIQEILQINNISIIFVTSSTMPRKLITSSVPTIFFANYTNEQVVEILARDRICSFPTELMISKETEDTFWINYVNLIVDSYFSFSTDIILLRRILRRLWDKFIEPITKMDLNPNEFHKVYRYTFKLLMSEYAVDDNSILDIDEDDDEQLSSNLSVISKYILVAAYIASFNDSKQDWLIFSKTKDIQRRRKQSRKRAKLSARLLEPSSFDFERLLAITHSIYELENSKSLVSNIDLTSQIANLASLKLLLKSQNQDYISAKVKWKVNASHEFIRAVAVDIGLQLDNYLTD